MSLEKILDLRHTLAFRLTLWYAGIFTVSALVIFFILYASVISLVNNRNDQQLLSELEEFSSLFVQKGGAAVKTEMSREARSEGVNREFFRLMDRKGRVIAASDLSSWHDIFRAGKGLDRPPDGSPPVFRTVSRPRQGDDVRVVSGVIAPDRVLQIGISLAASDRFVNAFRAVFIGTFVVLMGFSALVGWFMARHALRGVEEVTQTALEISGGAFGQRVRMTAKYDEIERLVTAFNRMLDRIHDLITRIRDVTDNVAHDLRSPIARIRGLAELKLNNGNPVNGCGDLAADTIEECDRLLEMTNTLLAISDTEAGVAGLEKASVDIARMVTEACELFRPVAGDKGLRLVADVSGPVFVEGDRQAIRRMLANLLDNALKYTPPGGEVTVSVDAEPEGRVIVRFRDTGIGIPEKDLPRIFDRLYRCDRSRSHAGFGLGLSLALAIARAHGGDITALSRPGEGSDFNVILPGSDDPSAPC